MAQVGAGRVLGLCVQPIPRGDVSASPAPVGSTAQRRLPHLGQNWTPSRRPQPEDGEPQDSPEAHRREGGSARPAGLKGAEWANLLPCPLLSLQN